MRILPFILLCLLTLRVEALTLIKRATFSTAVSNAMPILHLGNLGGFDSVSNSVKVVAVSPGVHGGLSEANANVGNFLTGTATNAFFICGWFKVNAVLQNAAGTESGTEKGNLLGFARTAAGEKIGISVNSVGGLYVPTRYGSLATNIAKSDWNFLAIAIKQNSGNYFDARYYHGTNLALFATNLYVNFGGLPDRAHVGGDTGYSGNLDDAPWKGKWSGFSLYSMAQDYSDVVYPADLPVPSDRMTYYLNTSSGSDTNDGATVFTPWQTGARLNFALTNGWIAPRDWASPGWVYSSNMASIGTLDDTNFCGQIKAGTIVHSGDAILLNTDGAPLYATNALVLRATHSNGLKVGNYGTNRAKVWFASPLAGVWSQYNSGSYPNVWQIAAPYTNAYVWEDWKWLRYPTSGVISAAAPYLNNTAGSMWCDGTNVYVHPFGDSNPNSDGKTYYLSRKLQGAYNGGLSWMSGIYLQASTNGMLEGLDVRGVFSISTNAVNSAIYGIQQNGVGRVVLSGLDVWHGGNHSYGSTHDTMTNFLTFIVGSRFGNAPPEELVWSSGFSSMVEHCANTGSDRRAIYWDSDWSHNDVFGSTAGTNTGGFFSHDGVTGTNLYTFLWLSNCVGNVDMGSAPEYMVKDGGWIIEGSRLRSLTTGGSSPIVRRCRIDDGLRSGQKGLWMEDSLLTWNYTAADGRGGLKLTNGPGYFYAFNRCTFDTTMARNVGLNQNLPLFELTKNADVRVTNCLIVLSATNASVVASLTDATSIFSAASNVYFGTNTMAGATNGSVYADPRLSAQHRPYADSPARLLGPNVPGQDITGRAFAKRGTAGAVEYVSPSSFQGFAGRRSIGATKPAVAGGLTNYIMFEDFEGDDASIDARWSKAFTSAAVNWNNTTNVIEGTKSLAVYGYTGDAANYAYTSPDWDEVSYDCWGAVLFKTIRGPDAGYTRNAVWFATSPPADTHALVCELYGESDGVYSLKVASGLSSSSKTVATFNRGTTNALWLRFRKGTGSNAEAEIWFADAGNLSNIVFPTDTNYHALCVIGDVTTGAKNMKLGAAIGSGVGTSFIYDRMKVSTNQIGSNWTP